MDEKTLRDELLKAVGDGLTPLREQIETETKKLGEQSAETKQVADRVNDRLDQLEAQIKQARHDAERSRPSVQSETKAAFFEMMRKGQVAPERKDMVLSDQTTGGFLVAEDFVPEILKAVVEFSPMRELARIRQTSSTSVKQPQRTGRPTAYWVAETASRTESQGAYGMIELPTNEAAAVIDISTIDLEDPAFNLETEIRDDLAEEFGRLEGAAFVSGDGVQKPLGFLNDPGVGVTSTATNDTFVADDILTLKYAVKTAYLRHGKFALNRGIIRVIRQMKASGTGEYLWAAGIGGAEAATIDGDPYVEMPDMPSAVADQARILAYGDWQRAYTIVDRIQLAMQRDPYTQAGNGVVRFVARRRVGGQLVLPEAIQVLKVQ